MIIDLKKSEKIDRYAFSSIPSRINIIKTYSLGVDNTLYVLKNPQSLGNDNLVHIDYSLMVYDAKDELKLVLSLERLDLRELSQLLLVPYRELQMEYNTKGQFAPAHVILYAFDKKEDYGLYTEGLQEDAILSYLFELLYDSLSEPLKLKEIRQKESF